MTIGFIKCGNPGFTFWPAPISLSDKETASDCFRVDLSGFLVHDRLLRLDNRARLAFIINTNYLISELEFPAFTACGKGLEDCDFALPVDYATRVKFRYTGNRIGLLSTIEVNHFLVRELERCRNIRE